MLKSRGKDVLTCAAVAAKRTCVQRSKGTPVASWALDGSLILQDLEGI